LDLAVGRLRCELCVAKSLSVAHTHHSYLTIPIEIHKAVMALSPEDRRDREKVNEAVRNGVALGPLPAKRPIHTECLRPKNSRVGSSACPD
jgi:hypothetical protein